MLELRCNIALVMVLQESIRSVNLKLEIEGESIMKKNSFAELNLKDTYLVALEQQGIIEPTKIQTKVIPQIQKGYDTIGQARTGTGKTLAYLLPILNDINPSKREPQAIVVVPTRELAQQVVEEVKKLNSSLPEEDNISVKSIVGGTDRERLRKKLEQNPHVVVGTPGRLKDMIDNGYLKFFTVKTLVIDEADQMLEMGFVEDLKEVLGKLKKECQILLFSATIPPKLQSLVKEVMRNPRHIQLNMVESSLKIEHHLVKISEHQRQRKIVEVAQAYNPYLGIIFANTKDKVDQVAKTLAEEGISFKVLHGDVNARARKQIMKEFKLGKFQYLLATDLAARGIDVEGLSHVINYELPRDLNWYVHRVGRTARAGQSGLAISLVSARDQDAIVKLRKMGVVFTLKELKGGVIEDAKEPLKKAAANKATVPSKPGQSGKRAASKSDTKTDSRKSYVRGKKRVKGR